APGGGDHGAGVEHQGAAISGRRQADHPGDGLAQRLQARVGGGLLQGADLRHLDHPVHPEADLPVLGAAEEEVGVQHLLRQLGRGVRAPERHQHRQVQDGDHLAGDLDDAQAAQRRPRDRLRPAGAQHLAHPADGEGEHLAAEREEQRLRARLRRPEPAQLGGSSSLRYLRTVVVSWSRLMGLTVKALTPTSIARWRTTSSLLAVRRITGTSRSARLSCVRRLRTKSMPFITGMLKSAMTRSTPRSDASWRPWAPSVASMNSRPRPIRYSLTMVRMEGLSSMIRIFVGTAPPT